MTQLNTMRLQMIIENSITRKKQGVSQKTLTLIMKIKYHTL